MNRKDIKAALAKKHKEFVESIKDKDIRKLVKKNSIISGGAIVSMLLGEEVKDYDIYFTNKETTLAVANYYVAQFIEKHPNKKNAVTVQEDENGRVKIYIKSQGVASEPDAETVDDESEPIETILDEETAEGEEPPKEKYRPVWLSSNAITLSNKVQLVIRFYGNADEIHENYDFAHCTSYWTSEDGELTLRPEALEAILARELRYIGSKYPLCSIIRSRKFIERGWKINAGQYLKMALQLNQLDLLDVPTLKDQLVGVDSAYFERAIDYIQSKQEQDPTWSLDNSYLVEVINKIF